MGRTRQFGMDRYSLLYLKRITNKDLFYGTWNSAQGQLAAWMGGKFGREWMDVYGWLSPFSAHLKLSQHFQSAILQYKIKSFFFFFKKRSTCWRSSVYPRRSTFYLLFAWRLICVISEQFGLLDCLLGLPQGKPRQETLWRDNGSRDSIPLAPNMTSSQAVSSHSF